MAGWSKDITCQYNVSFSILLPCIDILLALVQHSLDAWYVGKEYLILGTTSWKEEIDRLWLFYLQMSCLNTDQQLRENEKQKMLWWSDVMVLIAHCLTIAMIRWSCAAKTWNSKGLWTLLTSRWLPYHKFESEELTDLLPVNIERNSQTGGVDAAYYLTLEPFRNTAKFERNEFNPLIIPL